MDRHAARLEADRWLATLADFERRAPVGAHAFSLDGITRLLAALGDPHLGRRVIHVTGTKGKGTVVHACDAILAAHGVRTMRTTSPHLRTPFERVAIDGRPIEADAWYAHVLAIRDAAASASAGEPTWFEVVTTIAWLEARRCAVDVDLLEVGLGGRLDATNVCAPTVAVVTSIGLDHTAILGDTHDAIAHEKGGIIKAGRPVVLGVPADAPGGRVLRALAAARAAPVVEPSLRIDALAVEPAATDGPHVAVEGRLGDLPVRVRLPGGRPTAWNAALALEASSLVLRDLGRTLDPDRAFAALAALRVPGRGEWVEGRPAHLLDGAHTEESVAALAESVAATAARPRVLLLGITADRDPRRVFAPLLPHVDRVVATALPTPRTADPAVVAAALAGTHPCVTVAGSPLEGLAQAMRDAGPDGLVVTTGSFYLVAAVRERVAPPG